MYLNTDHSGLNKFHGDDDENFQLIVPVLRETIENGSSCVDMSLGIQKSQKLTEKRSLSKNVHWTVSRPSNMLFTGRAELLRSIENILRQKQNELIRTQCRVVITGMGGQGKSEMCLQIADRLRSM
jgi:polynucleotide 5'-kinase involved in rRNA processing